MIGDKEIIGPFRGDFFFLSNFYPIEIEYDGIVYPSLEHAYQSAKSEDVNWKSLCSSKFLSAAEIKRKGRDLQMSDVDRWNLKKESIMRSLISIKFTENKQLTEKLLDTENKLIIEINDWGDTFWGCVVSEHGTLYGDNILGKILMQIRSILQSTLKHK